MGPTRAERMFVFLSFGPDGISLWWEITISNIQPVFSVVMTLPLSTIFFKPAYRHVSFWISPVYKIHKVKSGK